MAVTESDDSHLCVLDKGTLTSLIFVELKAPFNTSSHKKKRKKEMPARPENVLSYSTAFSWFVSDLFAKTHSYHDNSC